MGRRRDQHEAVDAEGKDFEAGDIFGAGDDANVGLAVGDRGDDFVAQAFLKIDVHLRVRGEEVAQGLGQKFGQRVRVGQQAHMTFQAVGILAQLAAHPLCLLQQQSSVMHERSTRRRRLHALAIAIESGVPSSISMLRIRVLAAATARCMRSAPAVMLPASTMCTKSLRSIRSKRMRRVSCEL